MLPLQHVRLWRALSSVLVLVVLAAALAPGWWFETRAQALDWIQHADKWLHAIAFFGLTLWFSGLVARDAWWRMALGLLLFGLVIEGCQLLVSYRIADWVDVGANTLGILLGMAIAAAGLGGWGLRLEDWYSKRTAI
jgi:VanZ family protein